MLTLMLSIGISSPSANGIHWPRGSHSLHHLVLVPEGAGTVTSRQHHDVPKGPLRGTAGPGRRSGRTQKKMGPDVA